MPGQIIAGVGTTNPQKSQPISYQEPLLYFGTLTNNLIPSALSLPSGLYRFVLGGFGGGSSNSNYTGALCVATRRISSSDVVAFTMGGGPGTGGTSTIRLPDGTVMAVTNPIPPGNASASGGDVNISGTSNSIPPFYNNINGTIGGSNNMMLLIFKLG